MWFCSATIRRLEELASLLGPKIVTFLSQDDKANVPIGLTAANKQASLLMHVEYCVTLPAHDWVIAGKHKLTPSVYAGIDIKENGMGKIEAVSYSGPTYIAIRSGKHCSSTALSHGLDFERLLSIPEFDVIMKDTSGNVKPVGITIVDGGPDENPRDLFFYINVELYDDYSIIFIGIKKLSTYQFIQNNLDALFVATNAPGRSAFNRVERSMAPYNSRVGWSHSFTRSLWKSLRQPRKDHRRRT